MVYKTDAPGATVANEYTEGNPGTGVPATQVAADHLNMIQRELVALVLQGNLTPTKGVDNQVLLAFATGLLTRKMKFGDTEFSLPSAGGAAELAHLTAGLQLILKSGAANALANLQLREPGVGRGWDVAAGDATEVMQLGFKLNTGAATVAKFTFDKLGNLHSIGNAAKANNGYCRLTNGLILQWGRVTTAVNPGDVDQVITFPLAFPTACYWGGGVGRNPSSLNTQGCVVETVAYTASQLSLFIQYHGAGANSLAGFQWLAIGE
jgi:hypothetical protein